MFFKYLFIGFFIFLFYACDAPRNNPLDIHNPNRELGRMEGRVYSLSLPHQALIGVQIYFAKDSLLLHTDESGFFLMNNLSLRNGWLRFSKQGYHDDSVYVDWNGDDQKYLEIYLNANPVLDSLVFYSSISNRYPDIQILELTLRACIRDADNDIDSVFFTCPDLAYSTLLSFDTIEKFYEKKRISTTQLGISSAEEVIGHSFHIIVQDHFNHLDEIRQVQIHRIIRDEVELISPASHEVVGRMPVLRWQPVTPGYDFTYRIEVRTDEVEPQLIWEKGSLSPGSSSVQVDVALPKTPINSYIWAVWIIDNFGNRARSKYKSFQVE